ncbi:MAG: type IIL restriction-modification enzyme MmeI [Sedimenticola sp.]
MGGLHTNFKNLDYIACWFFLGANYISETNYQMAFVSTNSINQGQQVSLLWPRLFDLGLEIGFAHQSFKWTNNAKGNAGVTCVVVGLRNVAKKEKYIYNSGVSHKVNNINGYLIPADNIVVASRRKSLVDVPKMLAGNYTGHAQQLMLTDSEKEKLIERHPESERLIKRIVGSNEIIKGITRWCIWIRDEDKEFAETIPDIRERIHKVKNARESSRDKEANKLSVRPHQLRDINETTSNSIVVPIVSSENREYLPVAFIGHDTIVTNKAMVLYDCPPYIFAILSSRMHMVWVRAISGKLETRISYSNVICYNTFPFPELDESDKERLEAHVFNILDQRELYPEKSLAQLYDPNKMPNELRIAHHELDLEIDKCYRSRPFENDEKRLQNLFVLYEHMIGSEGA